MSAAWDGYEEARRRSRRRRRSPHRRRWLVTAAAAALLLATGFLIAHCQSPGGFLGGGLTGQPRTTNPSSDAELTNATAVVYNDSDPVSRDLAFFYAGKRGIAAEQVVGLKCSTEEEISREEYDTTIAAPLRRIFDTRGWWSRTPDAPALEPTSTVLNNRIRFMALIRGMPLKIRATPAYTGDPGNTQPSPIHEQNGASVDSELAVLGYCTHAISGIIPNPYYRSYNRITETACPKLMLVTRLDAPTGSMVERMITDSIAAEKTGLWGRCYLDSRGLAPGSSPHSEGDAWINKVYKDTAPNFLPTILDTRPEMFSREYPMTEAALYLGWYTENVAGPFTRPDFHFQPGAVACHLHSFSAVSVRDPAHYWVGPLLDRGAAAVLGNVYEPYLTLTVHFDILAARLCDGLTLAESAYAATPGLSWMDTVVGDPLYRPGKAWQDLTYDLTVPPARALAGGDPALAASITEGRAYWRGAQAWRARGAAEGGKALEKSGRELHSGRIYEGLGLLRGAAGDAPGARAAFEQARRYFKEPADDVRVILDEAQALADGGQKTDALELLRRNKEKYANQICGAALDQLETVVNAQP